MKRFLRKLYTALCVSTAIFPLTAILGHYLAPAFRADWFLSLLSSGILGAATIVVPGKLRIPWTILCAAGLGYLFHWAMLPGIILVLFAMLLTTPRRPGDEFSQPLWTCLLFFAIAVVIIAFFARKGFQEGAEFFSASVRGAFALYTGFFLLHLNHDSQMDSVSRHSNQTPPRSIRIGNRLLSLICIAVLYLFSCWGILKKGLSAVGDGIRWLLNTIFSWFTPQKVEGQLNDTAMESGGLMEGLTPGEAAPFWAILEYIAKFIAIAALVAGLLFLSYLLVKKLICFVRRMIEKMKSTADALSENYQDLAESIFDWDEMKRTASERLKNFRRPRSKKVHWAQLDSRQKVRYAYSVLRNAHPDLPENMTARQTLTEGPLLSAEDDALSLAAAYDAARYSDLEITSAQAQAMGKAARLGG